MGRARRSGRARCRVCTRRAARSRAPSSPRLAATRSAKPHRSTRPARRRAARRSNCSSASRSQVRPASRVAARHPVLTVSSNLISSPASCKQATWRSVSRRSRSACVAAASWPTWARRWVWTSKAARWRSTGSRSRCRSGIPPARRGARRCGTCARLKRAAAHEQ